MNEIRWMFPFGTTTPNKIYGKHWTAKAKEKKKWLGYVLALCGRPKNPVIKRKVKLEITLVRPRRYDRDNAYGSCKFLIDALRKAGWIWNDSEKFLDLTVSSEKGQGCITRVLWCLPGDSPEDGYRDTKK